MKWFCPPSMTSPVKLMGHRIGLTPYYLKKVVGIYCDSNGLVPLLVSGKRAKSVIAWYRIYRKRSLGKLWGSKVVTHYWNFNLWWCLYKKWYKWFRARLEIKFFTLRRRWVEWLLYEWQIWMLYIFLIDTIIFPFFI